MNYETAASLQYRNVLRQELLDRQKRNRRYSLRAFARDLKMSPSHLSAVLNDVDRISVAKAEDIATRLGFAGAARRIFSDLVALDNLPEGASRQAVVGKIEGLIQGELSAYQVHQDEFQAISKWQHLALLTAAELKRFGGNVARIAERLGIDGEELAACAKRLTRLGLAEADDESITPVKSRTKVSSNAPSAAIQAFHRDAFHQLSQRLATTPIFERFVQTTLMAADESEFEQMEVELEEFLTQFVNRYGSTPQSADQVYQLSVALVPLTEKDHLPT